MIKNIYEITFDTEKLNIMKEKENNAYYYYWIIKIKKIKIKKERFGVSSWLEKYNNIKHLYNLSETANWRVKYIIKK